MVIFFFFLNLEVALSYPGGDRPVLLPPFVDAPHALRGEEATHLLNLNNTYIGFQYTGILFIKIINLNLKLPPAWPLWQSPGRSAPSRRGCLELGRQPACEEKPIFMEKIILSWTSHNIPNFVPAPLENVLQLSHVVAEYGLKGRGRGEVQGRARHGGGDLLSRICCNPPNANPSAV